MSLNFSGNYIGGAPSGGGGGGASIYNGFFSPAQGLSLYSAATNTEYSEASLATYLPDDGEQYMACLWCQVHVNKTTVGNYINVCFDTDLTGTGGFFTAGSLRCVVANQESPITSIIWVPFGAGRKIKIQERVNDKGTFYIKATGYYRLTYSGS